jgi:hypothetical protein
LKNVLAGYGISFIMKSEKKTIDSRSYVSAKYCHDVNVPFFTKYLFIMLFSVKTKSISKESKIGTIIDTVELSLMLESIVD